MNTIKHEGKHLTVYQTEKGWEYVSRKPFTTFREGNRKIDAVVIVPIFHDEDGTNHIVITREYREPIGDMVYGFPAGLVDAGESGFDAAKRELKEETGLECVKVLHHTPRLFSSEGLTDECVSVIYLEVTGKLSRDWLQDGEDINTEVLSQGAAFHLMHDGEAYNYGKAAYFIIHDFATSGLKWLF